MRWDRIILTTMSLLLIGAPLPVDAQFVGVSSLAAMSPRFPCEAFLATSDFSRRPAMVILWGTFGDDLTCAARFTERYKDKPHFIEIHFSNETCRRNGNCAAGELRPDLNRTAYSKALERRDPSVLLAVHDRVRNIRAGVEAIRNANTFLALSSGLEDNYSAAGFIALVQELQPEWPYLIVRSGSRFLTFPTERHGLGAKCGGTTIIANVDGGRGSRAQERKFLRVNAGACLASFLWRAEQQGRIRNRWSPPASRDFIWTASDVIEQGAMLSEATN